MESSARAHPRTNARAGYSRCGSAGGPVRSGSRDSRSSAATSGGADFGSGLFDLTAGGARQGAKVRTLPDHSIGPVWEANHVWLIFVLVTWCGLFGAVFASSRW